MRILFVLTHIFMKKFMKQLLSVARPAGFVIATVCALHANHDLSGLEMAWVVGELVEFAKNLTDKEE